MQADIELGLWIVRVIVSAQGGTVRALSEGPDRGATIRIELPRPDDDPEASTSSGGAPFADHTFWFELFEFESAPNSLDTATLPSASVSEPRG